MDEITLRPITRENWRMTLALGVRPEQQRFVAGYQPIALLLLAKAYIGPLGLRWEPYAIYRSEPSGKQLIGLAELTWNPADDTSCWLNHFFIDQRYQGQGYGKRACAAFIQYVQSRFPQAQSLRLTVHPENIPAQALYRSLGFAPTSEELDGEPVYALTLDANGV
ncbi:MAG: GNAT family protein [Ktedonobacterales bacterium]